MATITVEKPRVRSNAGRTRPRLTAAQIADAIEQGKAEAARLNASVGGGCGNFTEDRHNFPGMTNDEVFAGIMRLQAQSATA